MIRTIIESPLGSRPDGTRASPEEFKRNQEYALRCMRHSLSLGEAPFASHVLYPLVLEDATPDERRQGMWAGFAWGERAEQVAVYLDYEITPGMLEGIDRAKRAGQAIRYRRIGQNDLPCSFDTSEGSERACDPAPLWNEPGLDDSPAPVSQRDVMASFEADNPASVSAPVRSRPVSQFALEPHEYAACDAEYDHGDPVG